MAVNYHIVCAYDRNQWLVSGIWKWTYGSHNRRTFLNILMTISLLNEGPAPHSCRCSEQSFTDNFTVVCYIRVLTRSVTWKSVRNGFVLTGYAPCFLQDKSWRNEVKGEGTANEDMLSGRFETSAYNLAVWERYIGWRKIGGIMHTKFACCLLHAVFFLPLLIFKLEMEATCSFETSVGWLSADYTDLYPKTLQNSASLYLFSGSRK
jgi:hypothetical protein